jgi:hypothetical protein
MAALIPISKRRRLCFTQKAFLWFCRPAAGKRQGKNAQKLSGQSFRFVSGK